MKRIQIVHRLQPFFSKKTFLLILCFLGGSTLLSVAYPFLYKLFIDGVSLAIVFLLMTLWLLFYSLIRYSLCKVQSVFFTDLLLQIKERLLDHIMKRELNFYIQKPASELKRVLEDDCNEIEHFFSRDIFGFLLSAANLCAFLVIMAFLSPPLLAGCVVFFCLSYLEAAWIQKRVRNHSKVFRSALAWEDHMRADEFKNFREIKCFNWEAQTAASFCQRSVPIQPLIKKEKLYWYINKYLNAMNHDLITRFFLYLTGGSLVIGGKLTISSFLVFSGFYENFVKEVRNLMDSNFHLNSKSVLLENVLQYLNPVSLHGQDLPTPIQQIKFHDVCFRYPESQRGGYVFRHFNGQLRKGETWFLHGSSGCGKSTLVKLLEKEWTSYEGSITINGQELSSLNSGESFYKKIAVVSHESRLFHTTLAENLRFADPTATKQQLQKACENALLPLSLDTPVGENGSALSGGQRQRLLLAQIFLKPSDFYLLDESLDEISAADEIKIVNRLRDLNPDSIIILISHRKNIQLEGGCLCLWKNDKKTL